jgi:FkbM family methyltransferase
MRNFNNIKDRHFPEGYPDWIQSSIDDTVTFFLKNISEKFKLEEIETIFDIGSLNGIESVKFTEKIKNCVVHTFEPNLESYKNVILSTEGIDNIYVHNLGVSNFNGKSDFYITYDNMGASSLLEPSILQKTGSNVSKTEVDVIKLDDWCQKNKINKIDLLWMDVQGSELNIFKGMGNLLNSVKGIYVEYSMIPYYKNGSNKEDVIDYLSKYNFKMIFQKNHDSYEGDFIFIKND